MAKDYFKYFPAIAYNQSLPTNLTIRVAMIEKLAEHSAYFFPYVVKDNERPDTLAWEFYGDPALAWVILLTNNVIDPYHDWYLNLYDFNKSVEKKYGSIAAAKAKIIKYKKTLDPTYQKYNDVTDFLSKIEWENLGTSEQQAYKKLDDTEEVFISVDTYDDLDGGDQAGFSPVDAFTQEDDDNENNRYVFILQRERVSKIVRDLERLLNDDIS